jgi:hypothetical protein
MTKGAKIALGCGCLVLLVGVAIVVVFGVGAFWAKNKLHQVTGNLEKMSGKAQQIEVLEKKANANPYNAPADGVIPEARLLKFLDVRKAVFAVYERYKPQIEALDAQHKAEHQPSLSSALEAGGKIAEVFTEARLAQMQALADVGMSEQEYRDIQVAVYKTAWAAESQRESGKLPAEAMREAAATAEAQQGATAGLPPEEQQKLRESMKELGQAAQALEVPKANVELFRKHEAEIKKYAMTGLELIGL